MYDTMFDICKGEEHAATEEKSLPHHRAFLARGMSV